jgi:hypothetical protein
VSSKRWSPQPSGSSCDQGGRRPGRGVAEVRSPAGRNGYALCTTKGLEGITRMLADGDNGLRDKLRGQLAIGLHRNVEVTDVRESSRRYPSVSYRCGAVLGNSVSLCARLFRAAIVPSASSDSSTTPQSVWSTM